MLLVEENHTGVSKSTHANNKMLYMEEDRPSGGSAHDGADRQEKNRRHGGDVDNNSRPSHSRGSQGGARNQQGKPMVECWYCGKKGHRESECWKKKADSDKSGLCKAKHGNRKRSHYAEGSRVAENGWGPAFVMKHKANSMKGSTSKSKKVWVC